MATQDATVQPCVRINTAEKQSTQLEQEIATDTVFGVHSEGVTGMRYQFMPCAWSGVERHRTVVILSYLVARCGMRWVAAGSSCQVGTGSSIGSYMQ